ncbi:MAG: 4-hydroxy-tetrahydrodipicolinate reductase [Candidatus Coatesbacteria bacterium]|mgnify:FL=1
MTPIIICGACGRMGRAILEAAAADATVDVTGLVDVAPYVGSPVAFRNRVIPVQAGLPRSPKSVVIDFTAPAATVALVHEAAVHGHAMVIGTTGLEAAHLAEIEHAARRIAIVRSANMSTGMNVLLALVRRAARAFGDEADVEILEAHHSGKKDAPSGSALQLADAVNEARGRSSGDGYVFGRQGMPGERRRGEVGIHAIRGGDIVGDHTVLFALGGERVELVHRAHSREAFALGAVRAAKFAATAGPGLYPVSRVLGLEA